MSRYNVQLPLTLGGDAPDVTPTVRVSPRADGSLFQFRYPDESEAVELSDRDRLDLGFVEFRRLLDDCRKALALYPENHWSLRGALEDLESDFRSVLVHQRALAMGVAAAAERASTNSKKRRGGKLNG